MNQGRFWAVLGFVVSFILIKPVAANVFVPASPAGNRILQHKAMTISHNPVHRQADWVFYELGPLQLRSCVERSDNFKPDPLVPKNESAALSDYKGSGFDRGHLSPAGDSRFDAMVMRESFFLSNMSPQNPTFNRGIWKNLENLVRAWGLGGSLKVVTGPILKQIDGAIGTNRVSIPHAYYKVLLKETPKGKSAIAIAMPQSARGNSEAYVMTVRDLENLSGLDFFQSLEPSVQDAFETQIQRQDWNFSAKFSYLPCSSLSMMQWISLNANTSIP